MKLSIKYTLILFAIFFSANLHSQWILQNSGTVNVLSGVSFTDPNNGTAAGLTHTILRTTNGGVNWVSQANTTAANLWGIQFINPNTGMVVGESGTVFKTTNGGAAWVNTFPPVENFWAVNVFNANITFVCGSSGLIIKTTDNGATWNTLNSGETVPLLGINFTDVNTGYCSGVGGKILKTTDGGTTWTPQTSGTTENLFNIKPINADTVYACGENGKIVKTTNGGAAWNPLTSGTVQRLLSISFSDAGTGSICGLANTILRTTNYGATWIAQFSGLSGEDFNGINFVNGTTGFCVGSSGNILKTTTGGFPFPSVPNLLSPANGANGVPLTAFLDWDSSAVSKTYQVQLGTDSLFTTPLMDTSNLVFSFMNVPSGVLNNNVQYYWHVRGTNAAGNGNWSPASRFRTIVALPLAPGLILPVNGAANVSITPSFDWDSTSPALYYRIQVSQDSTFATSEADYTNITESDFDLVTPALSHNARYYWHIQAINDAGSGPFSNHFNFTTSIAIPSAPTLVTPVNGAVNVSLIPVLDWRDDITVTSYQLQLSADSTFASTLMDSSGFTSSQLTVPAGLLSPVFRYYWRVRTTNGLGTGPFSEIWHFNTLLTAPGIPTLAAPPNGAVDISTIVTVDWHDVPLADSYKLQVSPDSTFGSTVVNINVSTSQYTIQGGILSNNTVYYWRVNATNTVGTSSYSEIWHFRTVVSAPLAAPSLISPANNSTISTLTPLMDWNDVLSTTGYKINIATDSLFISPVIDTNITISQYQVLAGRLNSNTTYYWRVRGFNIGGFGPWSSPVWNFITGPIGINMISTIIPKDYKLYNNYPNPFNPSTKIRFDLPKHSHAVISIFDLLGRQVSELINMELSPGTYEAVWNADNISSGIYFYRIETEQFTAVKKMLYVK